LSKADIKFFSSTKMQQDIIFALP